MTALLAESVDVVKHTHDGAPSDSHYVADFCRHPECRAAHSKYNRELRERKRSGDLVDRRLRQGDPRTLTPLKTFYRRRDKIAKAERLIALADHPDAPVRLAWAMAGPRERLILILLTRHSRKDFTVTPRVVKVAATIAGADDEDMSRILDGFRRAGLLRDGGEDLQLDLEPAKFDPEGA
jgi:hypothetical protein